MKNVLVAVAISAFVATPASAGFFDNLTTGSWPTKESEAYKVEAYGFDFRVYEWQSERNPNMTCMVAIGNVDQAPYMGLQCFPTRVMNE